MVDGAVGNNSKWTAGIIILGDEILRAIFRENRKSHDTRGKNEFFSSRQNIPFSNLIKEKIILGSSDSLYGRNYKKFEKSFFLAGFSYSKQQNPTATSRKR